MPPKRILIVASECAPLAKTGGLADVVGALPKALAQQGADVRVIMPWYRQQVGAHAPADSAVTGPFELAEPFRAPGEVSAFKLGTTVLPGTQIPVYLIDAPEYFDRESLYGSTRGDFDDNGDRFAFFCQAALQACRELKFQPDVIHCNDWHSALIPAYLKTLLKEDKLFAKSGSLVTIHNLAYQGQFGREQFDRTGLPQEIFTAEGVEFYGQMNFMKAGLFYADKISTVSKRYSEEIQGQEFGCGLEGVLRSRAADLTGIVNGLDYKEWSPETDAHLQVNYSAATLEKKEEQKKAFLKDMGLEYNPNWPLIGMVTRLDGMKGLSLVEEIMDYLLNMDLNIVILGTGDQRYENFLAKIRDSYPDRTSIHLTFSNRLAHQIEAASDLFLMPSRFEPCGLNQLISMRYGTLPVVRATGGLADTVKDFDGREGTGFVFNDYSSPALFQAIRRAVDLYSQDRNSFQAMQKRAMEADFSWKNSADAYLELYAQIVKNSEA